MIDLSSLNPCQYEATTHVGNDHCLILAGAGSGKTRVLTYRIAWLVEAQNVSPYRILAFTFTNKAANEMKQRTEQLLGEDTAVRLMTFHRFGLMFLKRYGHLVGLQPNFSVFDTGQSETLVKHIFENHNLKEKLAHPDYWTPRRLSKKIAYYKDTGKSANDILDEANSRENSRSKGDFEVMATLYDLYDAGLRENNAIDFADMLKLTYQVLRDSDDVRHAFQEHYTHILVDEFQDTNMFQIRILKLLCGPETHLTAVGDDDQSIYGWRGADSTSILRFDELFGACTVYKLEQNYRSTRPILACASTLIAHNQARREKTLWTETEGGEPVHCFRSASMKDEASDVVKKIKALKTREKAAWSDFAILFRVNSRSSLFETACSKAGVPYVIVGGTGFYEREEISDLLSYLRLLVNPLDRISLSRIINRPARNIGEKSVEKLFELLVQKEQFGVPREECLVSLLHDIVEKRCVVPRGGAKFVEGCRSFLNVLDRVRDWQTMPPKLVLEAILNETKYTGDYLKKVCAQKNVPVEEALERIQFLLALLDEHQREKTNDLAGFLEEISIVHPEDNDTSDTVKLMTLHSSKGLEFRTVFIVGAADRGIPLAPKDGEDNMEEERRLMYVGMTRARQRLFISYPLFMAGQGSDCFNALPSPFYDEMNPKKPGLIEWEAEAVTEADDPLMRRRAVVPRAGLTWSARGSQTSERQRRRDAEAEARYYDIPSAAYEEDSTQLDASESRFVSSREDAEFETEVRRAVKQASTSTVLSKNNKKIEVGAHVMHSVHGLGTVIELSGTGRDAKAVVNFQKAGRRTIVARFLNV